MLEPTVGSIFLDSGESLEAAQSQLETLVPKQDGARVMLLGGIGAEGCMLQVLLLSDQGFMQPCITYSCSGRWSR